MGGMRAPKIPAAPWAKPDFSQHAWVVRLGENNKPVAQQEPINLPPFAYRSTPMMLAPFYPLAWLFR
jgi:hypothetical protein